MTLIAPHFQKARKSSPFSFLQRDRYFIKTPGWLKRLYPDCLWDMEKKEKTLYLSFDDGPHPFITSFVLDILKRYDAKATFFCIGENVVKYPDMYRRVLEAGHATGNHTQRHINGWKTDDNVYLADIEEAAKHISSALFRPPYGRISRSQIKKLRQTSPAMRIVMWNILAGDWDPRLSPSKCYSRMRKKIRDGDIIVFHDSEKAWDRMSYALPRLVEEFSGRGFRFEVIG